MGVAQAGCLVALSFFRVHLDGKMAAVSRATSRRSSAAPASSTAASSNVEETEIGRPGTAPTANGGNFFPPTIPASVNGAHGLLGLIV